MQYAYPCSIVRDEEEAHTTGREAYNVTFPDVPEAITGGWSFEEALTMAEDALGVALSFYVNDRTDIPEPGPLADGQVLIPVPLIVAAKLELYAAVREQKLTQAELGDRLGISQQVASRLLDPQHRSHISQIERALRAVGRCLAVYSMGPLPTNPHQEAVKRATDGRDDRKCVVVHLPSPSGERRVDPPQPSIGRATRPGSR